MNAARATFGLRPNPNQATKIGAKATFGAALMATITGMRTLRPNADSAATTPKPTPMAAARRKPKTASWAVIQNESNTGPPVNNDRSWEDN